MQLFAKTAN